MKSPALALLLLAALGAGPLVPGQVAAEGEGYRIRLKHVPGQKTRYSFATEVTISGGPEGMRTPPKAEAIIDQEVLSVEDGIATLKVKTTGGPKEVPPERTIQVDDRGRIVGQKDSSLSGFPAGLPERPIKVGEEWSVEAAPPGMPVEMGKAKITCKFLGLTTVNKKPVAQIDYKISMAGETPLKGGGTVLLDPVDGQLLSTTTTTVMSISLPGSAEKMSVSISMQMKRL